MVAMALEHFLRLRRHPNPWTRRVAGILLVIGGLLGFLPVLGFWMLPLGLILLSDDIPSLRRRRRRIEAWWLRRRRAARSRRAGHPHGMPNTWIRPRDPE